MNKKNTDTAENYDGQAGLDENDIDVYHIRQNSQYDKDNKPLPDNNPFFEERSNPLSSKGN